MNITTQTSQAKIRKVPVVRLRKLHVCRAQTSHFHDTNRTSSLFGLSFGLWEESGDASPLRCRAASSPAVPFKAYGRGFPPSKPSPLDNASTLGRWNWRMGVRTLARCLGPSEVWQDFTDGTRMHKSEGTNRAITCVRFGDKATVGRRETVR
jgi:hypothetical protein